MEIINKRVASTSNSTIGILIIDGKPSGFVIEDEKRAVKVMGETRIPAGKYKLGIRKEMTPLTRKYRNRYGWFKYHIELLDVPNFTGIYIHVGNTEKDTAGCQIIGKTAGMREGEYVNMQSSICYREFYQSVYPLLKRGDEITYEIIDND